MPTDAELGWNAREGKCLTGEDEARVREKGLDAQGAFPVAGVRHQR